MSQPRSVRTNSVLTEHLLVGDRATRGQVCAAVGDRGLVFIRPRLVVLCRVREGPKQRIVTLGLDEAKRGINLGVGQFLHQAVQLLPVRHASIVLPWATGAVA